MSESPRFGGSEYFVARFLREYSRGIGSHRGCENSDNEVYPVFRALGCKPASPQFRALRMALVFCQKQSEADNRLANY